VQLELIWLQFTAIAYQLQLLLARARVRTVAPWWGKGVMGTSKHRLTGAAHHAAADGHGVGTRLTEKA
jgi:hypothetical protein